MKVKRLTIYGPGEKTWECEDVEFATEPRTGDSIGIELEGWDEDAYPDCVVTKRHHWLGDESEPPELWVYADLVDRQGTPSSTFVKPAVEPDQFPAMSARVMKFMRKLGIERLDQIAGLSMATWLGLPGIGQTSLQEIGMAMLDAGLDFRPLSPAEWIKLSKHQQAIVRRVMRRLRGSGSRAATRATRP